MKWSQINANLLLNHGVYEVFHIMRRELVWTLLWLNLCQSSPHPHQYPFGKMLYGSRGTSSSSSCRKKQVTSRDNSFASPAPLDSATKAQSGVWECQSPAPVPMHPWKYSEIYSIEIAWRKKLDRNCPTALSSYSTYYANETNARETVGSANSHLKGYCRPAEWNREPPEIEKENVFRDKVESRIQQKNSPVALVSSDCR